MIQQKSRLCFAAMKLAQWPTMTLGVSRLLWPGHLKAQSASLTKYSSTVVEAQNSTNDETVQKDSFKPISRSGSTASEAPSNKETASGRPLEESVKKINIKYKTMTSGDADKELGAVMKVKSLSEALEVCSTFNSGECLAALKNLAGAGTRPLPLIQNLTRGLSSSIDSFNIKDLSDLLFCLCKLSYIDGELLSKTCGALKANVKNAPRAAVLGSSVTSLRKLQWKDPELLDELSMWILNNFRKYQNPSTFLYTLALQNHSPENLDELVQLVWKDISRKFHTPASTVNLLWSLSVLNSSASRQILKKTLGELFSQRFMAQLDSSPHMIPVWIKLCNLHGASKSLLKNSTPLSIPEDVKHHIMEFCAKDDKVIMVSEVKEVLFKDMDTNLYATFVPTTMGFSIDLMCNLDEKMRAVPLDVNAPSCKRVAVMVHSYHECCQPTKEPNGYRSFDMRLLEDRFIVISLPYHILAGGHAQVYEYFESALKKIVLKSS